MKQVSFKILEQFMDRQEGTPAQKAAILSHWYGKMLNGDKDIPHEFILFSEMIRGQDEK